MDWPLLGIAFLLGIAIGNWGTNWAWRAHERRESERRRLAKWVD